VLCNLSLIVVPVAIVIIIVVVVVCVKKGVCANNSVGVSPNGEVPSNYRPPPPPALRSTGGYQNPLPPIYTVPIPTPPSSVGYPYQHPSNYINSRLPPINPVIESKISEEKPPSYEPTINENSTTSVHGSLEKPILPGSVFPN
jgi:hypothetical protein